MIAGSFDIRTWHNDCGELFSIPEHGGVFYCGQSVDGCYDSFMKQEQRGCKPTVYARATQLLTRMRISSPGTQTFPRNSLFQLFPIFFPYFL